MLEPALPHDEYERQAELTNLMLLDTASEERFDRITRTAQRLFAVPIALISLVDAERQWFKSCQGMTLSETPRKISFCGHAILSDEPLIVEDAILDVRFTDNPFVTGPAQIRFYAGIPLHGPNGYRIGSLCIIDQLPRQFVTQDIAALKDLAAMVENELRAVKFEDAALQIRESESRLRGIVDNVIDAIFTVDATGTVETANPAAHDILGYSSEELIGSNIRILFTQDSWQELEGQFNPMRQVAPGKGNIQLMVGQRKDGSCFPLELTLSEMVLKGRRCFTGIARDISIRQRNEEKIRESAQLLQAVMDSTSSYVHVRDLQGRYLYVNKEYEKVFKVSMDSLIGKTIESVFPPLLAQTYREDERTVLESGQIARTEAFVEQTDGMHTYLVVRSPLYNDAGIINGACGVGIDITRRKRDENMLRQLNQQLSATTSVQQAIFNSANFSIIATDIDGTIRIFSAGAERMLGYRATEMIASACPTVLHDPAEMLARAQALSLELQRTVAPGFATLVAKTLGGEPDEHEWTYLSKNGMRIPVMLSMTALWDEQQQLNGFLGIAYDLTERKKIENIKNEFISTVSHELRTPLTSIRGSLGLLVAGTVGEIPPAAKSLLDIATSNCERLVRLINDILDVEKIESGNMHFDMTMQDFLPLVEQAIVTMQSYADQFKVKFVLEVLVKDLQITADADRLTQVIVNLLSNAAKFSAAGSTVLIQIDERSGMAYLSVTDYGCGISDEFCGRIFQKFAQADSSDTRQKGGTGLGLSISKAIIEKHHGKIGFQSQAGAGTEFYIELPLSAPRQDGLSSNMTATAIPPERCPEQGKLRILHVENDPDINKIVGTLLRPLYWVEHALLLSDAREKLTRVRYDLILLDLHLDDGDSSALLTCLPDLNAQTPVVIFSGHEISHNIYEKVQGTLVKSRTSNTQLLATLHKLIGCNAQANQQGMINDPPLPN